MGKWKSDARRAKDELRRSEKRKQPERRSSGGEKAKKKRRLDGQEKKQKPRRTKFQQYLEMENAASRKVLTAEEDLAFEKQLAKKLGLKKNKVVDNGDGLFELATIGEGPSVGEGSVPGPDTDECEASQEGEASEEMLSESEAEEVDTEEEVQEEEEEQSEADRVDSSNHCSTNTAAAEEQKYVPPHQKVADLSQEELRLKRRVKGLLNRVSEDNLESITSELSDLFLVSPRRLLTDLVTNHVLESCSNGPRGNEQYATVFAGLIGGLASLAGIDFVAFFVASLASAFEKAYQKDDSLAARNLTLLVSSLYSLNVISRELVYDFLGHLCRRFLELDVSTILHLMQSCGMSLRNSDPSAMKEFILFVQQRTSELKDAYSKDDNESMSKRVEYMLDAICEVKNNKRRVKDEPAKHTRMKKWLQKLGVEDVRLTSVTWDRLLDPNKKGHWWHQVARDNPDQELAKLLDTLDSGVAEAERMLKLAASQRMNTDARRAIFSIVMSSEDYVDAFEKLLGLNLNGAQDREIVRVVVECCLQEKAFNKYYALLASKLCQHDKNHKFTLQYCVWDHFKELQNMEMRRNINLAKLLASLIGSFALSLTVLKAVDFTDSRLMTPKVVVHFRAFFQALLAESSEKVLVSAFSRITSQPELSALCSGLRLFLRQHVQKAINADDEIVAKRYLLVKKALTNAVEF